MGIGWYGVRLSLLRVDITEDLSWGVDTAELAMKAEQRLYFLRVLRTKTSLKSC